MKREEILEQYEVNDGGEIESPGKFEGEAVYAPHFWDMVLSGFGETVYDGDTPISFFEVTDEDRAQFPEISPETCFVSILEDTQGFVCCTELTEDEYKEAVDVLEDAAEQWEGEDGQ